MAHMKRVSRLSCVSQDLKQYLTAGFDEFNQSPGAFNILMITIEMTMLQRLVMGGRAVCEYKDESKSSIGTMTFCLHY
jgi:hypothetical protein